jgi:hypothetical protein
MLQNSYPSQIASQLAGFERRFVNLIASAETPASFYFPWPGIWQLAHLPEGFGLLAWISHRLVSSESAIAQRTLGASPRPKKITQEQ